MAGSERLLLGLSRLAPPVGPFKVPQGCKANQKKLDTLFDGAWQGFDRAAVPAPISWRSSPAGINTDWWSKAHRFIESRSHIQELADYIYCKQNTSFGTASCCHSAEILIGAKVWSQCSITSVAWDSNLAPDPSASCRGDDFCGIGPQIGPYATTTILQNMATSVLGKGPPTARPAPWLSVDS